VTPSSGAARKDPEMQKYPAVQSPVVVLCPGDSQYLPASQGVHSDEALRPVVELYVPLGHCKGVIVPAGQYLVDGQIVGLVVPVESQ